VNNMMIDYLFFKSIDDGTGRSILCRKANSYPEYLSLDNLL
jgi:hypothetical protein